MIGSAPHSRQTVPRLIGVAGGQGLAATAYSLTGAAAHTGDVAGQESGRGELTTAFIVIGLLLPAALYAGGTAKIWRQAGVGRGVSRRRLAAFAAGVIVLGVALLSPLDSLGAELFAAHMVQHVTLILVVAPLLVLGAPLAPIVWALPARWRARLSHIMHRSSLRSICGPFTQPLVAGLLGVAVLWLWHTPSLYDAALRDEAFHAAEHLSFPAAALLFWGVVLPSRRRQPQHGVAFLLVFATMLQSGALGALITFARSPWYAAHADHTAAWGLTPLEDQQLAGVIMWVPMGAVYLLAALWLIASWLRSLERSTPANGAARQATDATRATVPHVASGGLT